MIDSTLLDAYQHLVDECRRRGEVLDEPVGYDRRRHPRLRVRVNKLAQRISPWPLAIDISAAGMAFYTNEPADTGHHVRIALGDSLAAEADVLACQEVPLDLLRDPVRYRIRCRFADEDQGMRMLMAIKELEAGAPEED